MKKHITVFFPALLMLSSPPAFPQEQPQVPGGKKQLLKDAEAYFKRENYTDALPLYLKLDSLEPSNDYKFKAGVCYIYFSTDKKKAIEYLKGLLEKDPGMKDLHFYMGRAYHVNNMFDEAIEQYQNAKAGKISKENEKLTDLYLTQCNTAKEMIKDPVLVRIENIGPPVNTEANEYAPVISADESVLMFTYRGKKSMGGRKDLYGNPDPHGMYYEDVMMSIKLGGESWSITDHLGPNINIESHDACLGLSHDGQILLIFKDTLGRSGEIFMSRLEGDHWGEAVPLDTTINTQWWEGKASLTPDGKTIYFSSERPGGAGGKDLYRSTQSSSGSWGNALNLGPVINTPYDDDSPFMHADEKILYFSSKGHKGMGGYDIFVSRLRDDGTWLIPENIGYPINTTEDDLFYVVSANGERGYYSSAKTGGYGENDIYIVHPDPYSKEHVLLLVKGIVSLNDKPAGSEIKVTYGSRNLPLEGDYRSNSSTGKYLIILSGGTQYILTYYVEDMKPHTEKVDAANLASYKEVERDVKLYTEGYTPNITVSGYVFRHDRPTEPIGGIDVFLNSADGTISRRTTSDAKGFFSFDNLPDGKKYNITVDENALIKGTARSFAGPLAGLTINDTVTAKDGSFIIEISGFPVKYLTPYNPKEESVFSDPELYRRFIQKYGNASAKDLVFKVQIGAYRFPEKFNYRFFNPLGNVSTELFKDGITRFTMGRYPTINEADKVNMKARKIGDKDAFITVYLKGQRMQLSKKIAERL